MEISIFARFFPIYRHENSSQSLDGIRFCTFTMSPIGVTPKLSTPSSSIFGLSGCLGEGFDEGHYRILAATVSPRFTWVSHLFNTESSISRHFPGIPRKTFFLHLLYVLHVWSGRDGVAFISSPSSWIYIPDCEIDGLGREETEGMYETESRRLNDKCDIVTCIHHILGEIYLWWCFWSFHPNHPFWG